MYFANAQPCWRLRFGNEEDAKEAYNELDQMLPSIRLVLSKDFVFVYSTSKRVEDIVLTISQKYDAFSIKT